MTSHGFSTPAPDTWVLLSLGSNIEPRQQRLQDAVNILASRVLNHAVCSAFYETDPVGYTDQAPFLNMVVMGSTEQSAVDLHRVCKGLEAELGRQHRERWREREIDIDVVLFGDEILHSDNLTIPHPEFHNRRFVLQPAAEIGPSLVCPKSGCTMAELLTICTDQSGVRRV
jgi:2-amino-4-hydroxy-6-hydroxymethyldihydropteridine diphosphokinase